MGYGSLTMPESDMDFSPNKSRNRKCWDVVWAKPRRWRSTHSAEARCLEASALIHLFVVVSAWVMDF